MNAETQPLSGPSFPAPLLEPVQLAAPSCKCNTSECDEFMIPRLYADRDPERARNWSRGTHCSGRRRGLAAAHDAGPASRGEVVGAEKQPSHPMSRHNYLIR
jgi:hypothetical protein